MTGGEGDDRREAAVLADLKRLRGRRIQPQPRTLPTLLKIAHEVTPPSSGTEYERIVDVLELGAGRMAPNPGAALLILLGVAADTGGLDTKERRRRAAERAKSTPTSFKSNFEDGYLRDLAAEVASLSPWCDASGDMDHSFNSADVRWFSPAVDGSDDSHVAAIPDANTQADEAHAGSVSADDSELVAQPASGPQPLVWARKNKVTVAIAAVVVLVAAGVFSWVGVTATGGPSPQGAIGRPASFGATYCPEVAPIPKPGTGTVSVILQEEADDSHDCWTTDLAPVRPGSTIKLLLSYVNTSTEVQKRAVARVILTPGMILVPNSTRLADPSHPQGVLVRSNDIVRGGIAIGNFGAGQNAYLLLKVFVPDQHDLTCGTNSLITVGAIRADGIPEFKGFARLQLVRTC